MNIEIKGYGGVLFVFSVGFVAGVGLYFGNEAAKELADRLMPKNK